MLQALDSCRSQLLGLQPQRVAKDNPAGTQTFPKGKKLRGKGSKTGSEQAQRAASVGRALDYVTQPGHSWSNTATVKLCRHGQTQKCSGG